ncbi:MAG: hypothetical protein NTW32_05150 [Chloroflexi bacterium]|nr:hypothetical protein [Chloroflexota bacterium]
MKKIIQPEFGLEPAGWLMLPEIIFEYSPLFSLKAGVVAAGNLLRLKLIKVHNQGCFSLVRQSFLFQTG